MAKRKNKSSEAMIFCSGIVIGAVGFFILTKITLNHPVKDKAIVVKPVQKNNRDLDQAQIGKQFSKAGYLITWSNPRYEFDEEYLFDSFKIDVKLENESIKPSFSPVFNCNIVDGKKVIIEGSGVILNESYKLKAGENHDYVVTVPLEIDYSKESQTYSKDDGNAFPNRRVSSCRFTPTGSYDPNISVKVVF